MYIHWIGRTCLVATMLLLIRMRSGCMQLNTNVIRDRWNVHNFCDARAQLLWNVHNCWETCTTSLTRAQHLWNVRNISEMCTYIILENTGWGRWNTLYPYNIYIYIIYIVSVRLCATCFCFCHWGFGIAGTGLIERPQRKPTMTVVMVRKFHNKTLPKPDLDADM